MYMESCELYYWPRVDTKKSTYGFIYYTMYTRAHPARHLHSTAVLPFAAMMEWGKRHTVIRFGS